MELMLAASVGLLTAVGIWLLLRARSFDAILGLTLLSYAVNVFIFLMERVRIGVPPIIDRKIAPDIANYADPLPQALVLTAIVIGFALTCFSLVLAVRLAQSTESDDTDELRFAEPVPGDTLAPPIDPPGADGSAR
jgi:multicomponent K+:H+ antiporter subunit C